ncbi:MAG: cytochrome c oxidase subunit 3 [Thermoanaerobaculia bacterium]|nr:cytochrome c oxidase subunit 3 [Thermoanaerobaculia bacterium]
MSTTVIPYTTEIRPDTGVNNVKLGIWLFLASEIMLFGSLFAGYILLRTGNPEFGAGSGALSVPMATLNTVVLITSSVTMVLAWAAAMEQNFAKFRLYMGCTVMAGAVFLVVKGFEYSAKFEHHLYPSHSTFMAIYFTFTGLHALHVIVGMGYNAYLWIPGSKMFHSNPQQFANRVEASGLFWHFVDLVWIFLFPILYLLPDAAS